MKIKDIKKGQTMIIRGEERIVTSNFTPKRQWLRCEAESGRKYIITDGEWDVEIVKIN